MSKFAAWLPMGDGTRDRGEEPRGIEYGKKGIKIKKGFKTLKEIPIDEIVSVDAYRQESAEKGKKALSNAAVGGVLFGAAGAAIGAATASAYDWYGEIVTTTEKVTFRFHNELDNKGFIKWWEKSQKKKG